MRKARDYIEHEFAPTNQRRVLTSSDTNVITYSMNMAINTVMMQTALQKLVEKGYVVNAVYHTTGAITRLVVRVAAS